MLKCLRCIRKRIPIINQFDGLWLHLDFRGANVYDGEEKGFRKCTR
ncbi:hypothetical protein M8C21_014647 [Ambrosia artemisiifolia]|uniref:Uncharacterized protein n=1 Tax=Ambrosia artemisiifolia TaxID=4212 RepID=A0AAD5BL37_AMBAR|nr:hypothetical protein M8C21_014647 [Ambrosia artemisiifolia]